MELEKASARLAPRSPWQAVDLGTQLYRRWAGPSLRVWLAFTLLPFALLLGWALWIDSIWPLFLCWWLKPMWERPLLAYYSHALFGEALTVGQLFRRWRQYALPGLLSQLTWRRLSPARSFNTCVWQLEGARGEQLRQRLKVLNSYPSNRSGTMTVLMFHVEQCMTIAIAILLYTLVPWQFSLEWSDWYEDQGNLQTAVSVACWYLALCITEPLYVACGFALYLNKRTWLEGWDLQLGLTRLGRQRKSANAAPLALVLLALLSPLADHAGADDSLLRSEEQQQVVELLASPEYMPFEERSERRWKNQEDGDSWLETFWKSFFDNLDDPELDDKPDDSPFSLPDELLWVLFWGTFIALGLWLLTKVFGQVGGFSSLGSKSRQALPTHVAGMDIRRQSLPSNLREAVITALNQQDIRTALSLILRTVLADLLHRYPVALSAGSTEQQCLRSLQQQHGEPLAIAYLKTLTQAWVSTAWAHRPVGQEQVIKLLGDWEQIQQESAHD